MLYKKYHRDFVRQFKVGVKVKYRYDDHIPTETETAITNPFVGLTLSGRYDIIIETARHTIAPLVYWSGRLVRIYVI